MVKIPCHSFHTILKRYLRKKGQSRSPNGSWRKKGPPRGANPGDPLGVALSLIPRLNQIVQGNGAPFRGWREICPFGGAAYRNASFRGVNAARLGKTVASASSGTPNHDAKVAPYWSSEMLGSQTPRPLMSSGPFRARIGNLPYTSAALTAPPITI